MSSGNSVNCGEMLFESFKKDRVLNNNSSANKKILSWLYFEGKYAEWVDVVFKIMFKLMFIKVAQAKRKVNSI